MFSDLLSCVWFLQGPVSPQGDSKSVLSAGLTKRKARHTSESTDSMGSPASTSGHQSILSLVSQHGMTPQQIQQLLMVQSAAGATPPHLQQLLQAQHSAVLVSYLAVLLLVLFNISQRLDISGDPLIVYLVQHPIHSTLVKNAEGINKAHRSK